MTAILPDSEDLLDLLDLFAFRLHFVIVPYHTAGDADAAHPVYTRADARITVLNFIAACAISILIIIIQLSDFVFVR